MSNPFNFDHMNPYSFKDFSNLNDSEIKMVWEWRNHPLIRQWMYDKEFIELESHKQFISTLKNSTSKKYWLVKRGLLNVGVFSLVDINNNEGEWGYYIASDLHEMNLMVEFYYYSLDFLFQKIKMQKLYGYANKLNIGANSLNDLFGFSKHLINKEIKQVSEEYYFRELTKDTWASRIKTDKRILRLLQFTENKF